MKRLLAVVICLAIAIIVASAQSAADVLETTNLFGAGSAIVARFEMRTVSTDGEKTREIELFFDRSGGRTRTLAKVVSPAFLSGMKFLKVKEKEKPDAQWLKTSSGLRRLGESDSAERIFGSTFTVEDFGNIDTKGFDIDFTHEEDGPYGQAIRARPKAKKSYAEKIIWVNHSTGLVMALEYRDQGGVILRRYRVTRVSETDSRPLEAEMNDLTAKATTYLHVLSIEEKLKLPDKYFTPGSL